jgi:hypothetical protein
LAGQVRWVDHPAMTADGLTKLCGNLGPLYDVLAKGTFKIKSEEAQMSLREHVLVDGQSSTQIRKSGVKEKLGSCENFSHCHALIDP